MLALDYPLTIAETTGHASCPTTIAKHPHLAASVSIRAISLTLRKYKYRLADKDADCDATCRLRFHVFNAKLDEGLLQSYTNALDQDKFDQICDHLIAIDTGISVIVGPYRMQLRFVAA